MACKDHVVSYRNIASTVLYCTACTIQEVSFFGLLTTLTYHILRSSEHVITVRSTVYIVPYVFLCVIRKVLARFLLHAVACGISDPSMTHSGGGLLNCEKHPGKSRRAGSWKLFSVPNPANKSKLFSFRKLELHQQLHRAQERESRMRPRSP